IRKNLEHAEAKLRKLQDRSRSAEADDSLDEEPLSVEELTRLRSKLLKEINSREIEIFRVRANRFPNEVSYRLDLGTRLLKADLVDEAVAELQQAKRDERQRCKAGLYLGLCLLKRNDGRLAQRDFEDSLAAMPTTEQGWRK